MKTYFCRKAVNSFGSPDRIVYSILVETALSTRRERMQIFHGTDWQREDVDRSVFRVSSFLLYADEYYAMLMNNMEVHDSGKPSTNHPTY